MAEAQKKTRVKRPYKSQVLMIDPIDYLILAECPDEGTVMGYFPLGATSQGIQRKLGKDKVTHSQIGGRISSLHSMGHIVPVGIYPAGAGKGWQITAEGKKVLAAWRKKQKSPQTEGASE